VTPAQAVGTQVALSTSNSVAPVSGWQAASIIDSNALWAVYYTTPAAAGSYYVWVQTAAGAETAVSSFTISVT
ncbi:MAG TPA: collagen-like protein, partial [Acidocella sp.]|nr:collagen-like protein [Acidocella sp.]